MIVVYSDAHRAHIGRELKDARLEASVECPQRVEHILCALCEAGHGPVAMPPAQAPDARVLKRVHTIGYLNFLETAFTQWRAAHDSDEALPVAWPARGLRAVEPRDIDGRLGYFSFDAGTPIVAGTWQAAMAAAAVAADAAHRVASGEASAAFALCRPPGHHAGADFLGGYCFLNNAAVAAETLLAGGADRVAILDVDYHHGNGTQSIFYTREDVLFVSLHADPAEEYPYFAGYADETGAGPGVGFTLNLPLPPGTEIAAYLAAMEQAEARISQFAPDVLVVSLGVDTHAGDPLGRFRLAQADFAPIGAAISGLGRPTAFIMEGGYALDAVGASVAAVLSGFADGH